MSLAKTLLGIGAVLSLALCAGSAGSIAQDKAGAKPATKQVAKKKKRSKCKDGETSTVAAYKLSKGKHIKHQIEASLTGKPGDPKKGLKWMVHRRLGNCVACHESKVILKKAKADDPGSLKKYGFHGKIAPPLDGAASRYTVGELRLIMVDSKQAFPKLNTIMPSFHKNAGLKRVIGDCKGLAILSAERVEDVVAYLATLK
jgi:sulfur-oxidizing protein SoxX